MEQLCEGGPTRKSSLCACSLTSSKFWLVVRPLLFRRIVIRSPDHIHKLVGQVRDAPQIALWIDELQIEGRSIPPTLCAWSTDPSEAERDCDTWIYSFFSDIGSELPNVRILKLFGFRHLSRRREDLISFSRWIPQLALIRSVRELHITRCETSPNALTAIVRAFPQLLHLYLTSVCVGSPDQVSLVEPKPLLSAISGMSLGYEFSYYV